MADQLSLTGTLNIVLPSASSMNRKALRKARKSAVKTMGDIVVPVADNQEARGEESSIESRLDEDTIEYECCICGDDFPFSTGVAHCAEHFMCNGCVVDAYNAALADTEAFPAQCCTPLPPRFVEHLLNPEVREAYSLKAEEYYTPRAIRVYCVNEHCRLFIPKSCVENDHTLFTVACCGCGTKTCVGCKNEWEGQEHRCADSEGHRVRPKWIPEYSASCRAKSCPNCRVWMEHKGACNHMTCHYCRHDFCFVCLQPWTHEGFHEDSGCPTYGDPVEGYDTEGYELGRRGLHRDTGYDRAGFNRFGQQQLSYAVGEGTSANEDLGRNEWAIANEDLDRNEWAIADEWAIANEDLDRNEWEIDFEDDEDPGFDEYGYNNEAGPGVEFDDDEQYSDNEQVDGNASEGEIELDQADPAQNLDGSDGEAEAGQDDQANNVNDNQVELPSVEAGSVLTTTGSEVDAAQNEAASAASTDEADQVEAAIAISSDPAPAIQRRPRPSPPSDLVRQQIRLARRVPILTPNPHPENRVFNGGTPSFRQLECSHSWHRRMLYRTDYGYAHCLGCLYTANSWTNYCSTCGVVACDWCTYSFRERFVARWDRVTGLLDVLVWAEEGVVPFKAERRRESEQLKAELWADCDGDWLGLATMMEVYEAQLCELQPYLYWDFGIQLMFEELELEMQKEYWAVTEEDVGIPGLTLTFDLATNPFAPLHWDR